MSSVERGEQLSESGPDWVRDAVFYQVFADRFYRAREVPEDRDLEPWGASPRRDSFFGGDLAGITHKLPHLTRLGVNALYLTPIFAAGSNHRYDTRDYLEIDPLLGDTAALQTLVREAHAEGIRVILDGVFNHVGDGFWAFRDVVVNGEESACREWFFAPELPLRESPPNYQTCGGASFLPKLNTAHPDVRAHLLDVATHWIREAGIDGWRLDVPWKVPLDFWRAFRAHVKQALPGAYLVGEAWWSWGELRRVFDGLMNYRLRSAILDFCVFDHMDAEDFAIELQLALDDSGGGDLMLNLLGSHDTARLITVAGGNEQRVALALVTLFALPGTPLIYYGDEIGLEGGDDPDCRRTMEWDEGEWRTTTFHLTQTLVRTRRESDALRRGATSVLGVFNRVLVLRRRTDTDDVIAAVNAGEARVDFAIPLPHDARSRYSDVLGGGTYDASDQRLVLGRFPAHTAILLRASDAG